MSTQGEKRVCFGGDWVARGEGEREDAWPEEEPPLLDWCSAVRGSRSKAGAGREVEDEAGREGRDGERTAGEVKEDSDSMVMAGQAEEEEEDPGVMKFSTGTGADSGSDLTPMLVHEPDLELELKPAWTFDGNALIWYDD